jgi:hypothetical protein
VKDSVVSLSASLTRFRAREKLRGMEDEPQGRRDAVVTPATIRATARVHDARVFIRAHLWTTWGEIAIDEEVNARSARADQLKLAAVDPGKQGLGEPLLEELRASLVSVAAAAHSLDALYGVLADMVLEPELREKWRLKREAGEKGPPRHRQVFETIKRAVAADSGTLDQWRRDFTWLFDLRDAALHFREETSEAVPHPSGTTNSSAIYVSYCVENAGRAVDLLLEVLGQAVSSPRPSRPDFVKWASDFAPSVERLSARRGNN